MRGLLVCRLLMQYSLSLSAQPSPAGGHRGEWHCWHCVGCALHCTKYFRNGGDFGLQRILAWGGFATAEGLPPAPPTESVGEQHEPRSHGSCQLNI